MLTTRRQFLATTAGGLLLAATTAHAQIPPPGSVNLYVTNNPFDVTANYRIFLTLTAGGNKYNLPISPSMPRKREWPTAQLSDFKTSDTFPLSIYSMHNKTLQESSLKKVTLPVGQNVTISYRDNAGTHVCRFLAQTTYEAKYAAVTIHFSNA